MKKTEKMQKRKTEASKTKKRYLAAAAVCLTLLTFGGCEGGEETSSAQAESSAVVSALPSEEPSEESSEISEAPSAVSEASSEISEISGVPSGISEAPAAEGDWQRPQSLSADLYSFQLQIDGEIYQFPMSYPQFLSYGWRYLGDEAAVMAPNEYTVAERMQMGDAEVYVSMVNFDLNSRPLSECYVGGITLDTSDVAEGTVVTLPGGQTAFDLSAEKTKEAYGTPSYENTLDSGSTTIEYSEDSNRQLRLVFDAETKTPYKLELRNFQAPADFVSGTVTTETPAEVAAYQAPVELGDSFEAFTVEFGGDLYQLPAPVSKFIEKGWTLKEEETEMTVPGKGYGWVTLSKDNQQLRAIANNYSDNAADMTNCFLTSVKGSDYAGEQIDIRIPKGIAKGMTQAELETALAGLDFTKEESSSYTYYELAPGKSTMDRYEILVDSESGLVYKIEVKNAPKQLGS